MELFENLFRLWWQLFLSLSTFSKIFTIVIVLLIVAGAIEKVKKNKEEQKLREAKLKAIKREEKGGAEEKEEKGKIDDFLLRP